MLVHYAGKYERVVRFKERVAVSFRGGLDDVPTKEPREEGALIAVDWRCPKPQLPRICTTQELRAPTFDHAELLLVRCAVKCSANRGNDMLYPAKNRSCAGVGHLVHIRLASEGQSDHFIFLECRLAYLLQSRLLAVVNAIVAAVNTTFGLIVIREARCALRSRTHVPRLS